VARTRPIMSVVSIMSIGASTGIPSIISSIPVIRIMSVPAIGGVVSVAPVVIVGVELKVIIVRIQVPIVEIKRR
jgi:hypothetical protein